MTSNITVDKFFLQSKRKREREKIKINVVRVGYGVLLKSFI